MPCYHPMEGYRSRHVNKSGKRSIVFNTEDGYADLPVKLPCGQCYGCRLEKSRQWAVRCVHEAQMHRENAFITLTYNEENLPEDKSISKRELQTFFKRLRKAIHPIKIKFFACGEYGDKSGRAHYHAIIFGYGFPDKTLWTKTRNGDLLFRSKLLEKCWKKGHTTIGAVTFESAAYVARYVMKKAKGNTEKNEKYSERYNMVDEATGELYRVQDEFCLMSRGGRKGKGLAYDWFEKYRTDTDKDFITLRGVKMSLPKYYDQLIQEHNEEDYEDRKLKRYKAINQKDNTWDRLLTREQVKIAQTKNLERNL